MMVERLSKDETLDKSLVCGKGVIRNRKSIICETSEFIITAPS